MPRKIKNVKAKAADIRMVKIPTKSLPFQIGFVNIALAKRTKRGRKGDIPVFLDKLSNAPNQVENRNVPFSPGHQ
jgi:hypothetical protein